MQLRDEIGILSNDADFADLFPTRGQPAYAPWRLALITIFQFIENLSDRAASDAVRARIDWKYVLSLELEDSGFDSTVLCEFRARLVAGNAENSLFDKLLDWCRERKMLKARGKQRSDSTHILAAVRGINRLECVLESMRFALNAIAKESPEWLNQMFQEEWLYRYYVRGGNARVPHSAAGRQEFAEMVGRDAHALLDAVYHWSDLLIDRKIKAVEILRRVVIQQFYVDENGVHWRTNIEGTPPSIIFINSPYDLEAHYGKKRSLRTLTILPEVQYESQRKIREREKTVEYRKEYQQRSGIEGTISQAVRGFGIRRSRYIGQAKTHLQQIVSATAINFVRINNWLHEVPLAKTRQPLFAKVMREKGWQN